MRTLWLLRAASLALLIGTASLFAIGCGGDSSADEGSIEAQLEEARREGALTAHRQERMRELQLRVARLERRNRQPDSAAPVTETPSAGSASTVVRLFHTPSGNVACAILSDGATCSVITANETFVLENGSTAWSETGTVFSGDSGELAPYGSTVVAGQVSCSIPVASEPRGIVCTDSESGHGFEASRVESRQSTF